jgi:3-methyl-2-oxobutanoate hydroxymethyltransferase
MILEAIPADLAAQITEDLSIPTIGIGAGPSCDGQVLVIHDVLGLFERFVPKFVKQYVNLKDVSLKAVGRFREEVERGEFPGKEHSF